MYLLINEMNAIPGLTVGRVLSCHRTIAAALAADRRLQKLVKSNNGQNSYLPTSVHHSKSRFARGQIIHIGETELVSPEELVASERS